MGLEPTPVDYDVKNILSAIDGHVPDDFEVSLRYFFLLFDLKI
jgi:hypothetical protein